MERLRILMLLLLMLFIGSLVCAQTLKHTGMIALGDGTNYASINYERFFSPRDENHVVIVSARVGVGIMNGDSPNKNIPGTLTLPHGIGLNLGYRKHFFEVNYSGIPSRQKYYPFCQMGYRFFSFSYHYSIRLFYNQNLYGIKNTLTWDGFAHPPVGLSLSHLF